mmetsp:Transcript_22163/g.32979  ORF Transcript_22163/g.32979 Transcript_22163/m.32979 type:complete len:193 (-) Transcript_22163:78-656(-)
MSAENTVRTFYCALFGETTARPLNIANSLKRGRLQLKIDERQESPDTIHHRELGRFSCFSTTQKFEQSRSNLSKDIVVLVYHPDSNLSFETVRKVIYSDAIYEAKLLILVLHRCEIGPPQPRDHNVDDDKAPSIKEAEELIKNQQPTKPIKFLSVSPDLDEYTTILKCITDFYENELPTIDGSDSSSDTSGY